MIEVTGYTEKNTRTGSPTDSTAKLINDAINATIADLWNRYTDQCELSI